MRYILRRCGLVVLLSVFSLSTLAATDHKKKVSAYKKGALAHPASHALPAFNQIMVGPNLDIHITGGHKKSALRVVQSNKDTRHLNFHVKNKILYLSVSGKGRYQVPLRVGIDAGPLDAIDFSGNTTVRAFNLKGKKLDINDSSSGLLQLHGEVDVYAINASGNANIDLQWVSSSSDVHVNASGKSRVRLAGVANQLHLQMTGQSQFYGQYLRAKDVWVKTAGSAEAHVLATESLRAFAKGQSNIYYYKAPSLFTKRSIESGNIFQAGWSR